MDQSLQNWSAWATILGTVFTILAVLIAILDFKVSPQSRNFLKQLVTNRWFLFTIGGISFGFALWFQYNRAENLAKLVTQREAEVVSAYATQTAQAIEFANKPTSTPEIREAPITVTVEIEREVTKVVTVEVERAVTVVVERQVTVLAPTHTPLPTYTPPAPLPTYTLYPPPPTLPPVVIIVTATPTSIPVERVPTPDSRLKVGETWEEDNIQLTLRGVEFETNGDVIFDLKLENHTGGQISYSWNADNFSLVDNAGNKYTQSWCNEGEEVLDSGKSAGFHTCNWGRGLFFRSDDKAFFNQLVTEMTLTAQGVSRIKKAQWYVVVPH